MPVVSSMVAIRRRSMGLKGLLARGGLSHAMQLTWGALMLCSEARGTVRVQIGGRARGNSESQPARVFTNGRS